MPRKKNKKESSESDFDDYDEKEAITAADTVKKTKSKKSKKRKAPKNKKIKYDSVSDESESESGSHSSSGSRSSSSISSESHSRKKKKSKSNKDDGIMTNRRVLKRRLTAWLDYDDRIKSAQDQIKEYRQEKKEKEEQILKLMQKMGMETGDPVIVTDDKKKIRASVHKFESKTKTGLKEETIKNALMETLKKEKQVDQIMKKIEGKRETKSRFYLKRTKGPQPKKRKASAKNTKKGKDNQKQGKKSKR